MKLRRVAALSAAVLLMGATAASAAGPPYTVSVGGNTTAGTSSVSATTTGTVAFSIRNNAGSIINYNCTSIDLGGNVTRGTAVNPLAAITSTNWRGCSLPGGALSITQSGTWNITGTGTNATAGTADSVAGFVGNVTMGWATTANPAVCNFTVSGQMNGSLDESRQQLRISETGYTGNLTVSNVSGCLGRVQNGNPMNMAMTFNITSPGGAINLS